MPIVNSAHNLIEKYIIDLDEDTFDKFANRLERLAVIAGPLVKLAAEGAVNGMRSKG